MANTTSTLVKSALSIPVGVTYHDARIATCVSAANRYVLGKVRQTSLAVVTSTEYPEVYGTATRMIVLRRRPVIGIVAVTNDQAAVAATSYRVDTDAGILYRTDGLYWSGSDDGVLVHYGAGYDSTTVPDDLVEAATEIAASMFNRGHVSGLDQHDDGGVDARVSSAQVPPAARAILNRYQDITP